MYVMPQYNLYWKDTPNEGYSRNYLPTKDSSETLEKKYIANDFCHRGNLNNLSTVDIDN